MPSLISSRISISDHHFMHKCACQIIFLYTRYPLCNRSLIFLYIFILYFAFLSTSFYLHIVVGNGDVKDELFCPSFIEAYTDINSKQTVHPSDSSTGTIIGVICNIFCYHFGRKSV